MKKLLCLISVFLLLGGCSSNEKKDTPAKTTVCTKQQTLNDITFKTTQKIEYVDDLVKKQTQTVTAQFKKGDEKTKKSIEDSIKENQKAYQDLAGITFQASLNKEYVYEEVITFDFDKVTGKDYGKLTNQKLDGDKVTIDYQQSIDNLKTQEFTCE